MPAIAPPKLMTTKDLLAIPDDGVERWLIDGKLHERYPEIIGGAPKTVRDRTHGRVLVNTATELKRWMRTLPAPQGEILGGAVGIRLCSDPETTIEVDLVYVSAELVAKQTDKSEQIDGVPTLAVDILSGSDTVGKTNQRLRTYREFKVPIVWIVNPCDSTLKVYQDGASPRLFNLDDELTAEPHLPGFRARVANFFE